MFKYIIILFIIIIGNTNISFGQCLCGHIYFQIKVSDLQIKHKKTNYSIQVEIINNIPEMTKNISNKRILKENVEGDFLNFSVPTGGGIDTLKIIIKNVITKEEMTIITTELHYDTPYYIDQLQFSKGQYVIPLEKDYEKLRKNGIKW